jgi:hypothetical protein
MRFGSTIAMSWSAAARAAAAALLILLAACGPSSSAGDDDDDGPDGGPTTSDPCNAGETRCDGLSYQTCQDGVFAEEERCGFVCDTSLGGCAECQPGEGEFCVGNEVHGCNPDGTVGPLVTACSDTQICYDGTCTESDDCDAAAELIYVVDDSYHLRSFDPEKVGTGVDPFTLIGQLDCPAAPSLPGAGGFGNATPFSMSVDRSATAWVLYTSGEIFHVSTADASCQASGFQVGQNGWNLFGMGFVADSAGSDEETLWISGGPTDPSINGNLGRIDPSTMQVTTVAALPTAAEYSPEMTGTGDGELFGYFPGASTAFVAGIDKGTAQYGQRWDLNGLGGQIQAWAFAHWGGRFYIFVTVVTDPLFGTTNSMVILLDPTTGGTETTLMEDLPFFIVGAGVSTCAPVYVP